MPSEIITLPFEALLANPSTPGADPYLAATGSITVVAVASLVDNDYFTIDDDVNTPVVLEFKVTGGFTPTGGAVEVIDVSALTTATEVRDAVITAINESVGTLDVTASAGGAAVVTLTADDPEVAGASGCSENVTDGGFAITGLATPSGATTYKYKITYTSSVDGEETAASAEVTEAAGPATLDELNKIKVTWTTPASVASIKVYRTETVGIYTKGLIGTVVGVAGAQSFDDTGIVGDDSTPNATNLTGTAEPVGVLDLRDKYLQVGGTFTATIQIQGSVDGTNYVSEGSAITTASTAAVAVNPTYQKMRAVCTAYTSGTPTVVLTGHR